MILYTGSNDDFPTERLEKKVGRLVLWLDYQALLLTEVKGDFLYFICLLVGTGEKVTVEYSLSSIITNEKTVFTELQPTYEEPFGITTSTKGEEVHI